MKTVLDKLELLSARHMAKMYTSKPLRLPRKRKKDIIKVAGRAAYQEIMYYMAYQVYHGGGQYIKLHKA